jgi:hypothetical protein
MAPARSWMSFIGSVGIALVVTATSVTGDLAAQWPRSLAPGDRVRVRLPEAQYQLDGSRAHLIRGRITGLVPDTLYLAVTDSVGPLVIPRSLVQRLDISRGAPSRGVSALQRGLIFGVANALAALVAFGINDEPDGIDSRDAALVWGGSGLVIGGVLGALYPRERWKRVQLDQPSDR